MNEVKTGFTPRQYRIEANMNWERPKFISVPREREKKHNSILDQALTHSGVTKTVGEWLRRTNMRQSTVINRVTKQGLNVQEALTRPDKNGNRLCPLTTEEVAEERKHQRRKTTDLLSEGGGTGYSAVIGTDTGPIDLGTFNTKDEATHGLNAAMARLPEEWDASDQGDIETPLNEELAKRIEQRVNAAFAKHNADRINRGRIIKVERDGKHDEPESQAQVSEE